MRIALLTNFVPPYRLPLYRALRERAGELRVLASTGMEADRSWAPAWGDLDVILQRTLTLRRTWRHERFHERYEQHVPWDTLPQLARWRPDAVISAEFGARSLQALLYARAARIPALLWATGVDHLETDRGAFRRLARRALLRAADGVLVNGAGGARYIRGLGFPDAAIHRVPYAIELGPFTALPATRPPDAARRLLYTGSLSERKGVDVLLRGVAEWGRRYPAERLHLTIVGQGPAEARLRALELPANVAVAWAGAVAYDALPSWYAGAGLAIFPTLGDEWGLVVQEAMAAGVPVIGSVWAQAVDELVRDGANGWRFRPDDPGAVADVLARALATPDAELAEMRHTARATARRITPELMAGRIMAAFDEAMK
ncbi:MAG: glycosyltransferase family 4 protein [Gemmatimonadota bacterium]